jgi:hypothetical protein
MCVQHTVKGNAVEMMLTERCATQSMVRVIQVSVVNPHATARLCWTFGCCVCVACELLNVAILQAVRGTWSVGHSVGHSELLGGFVCSLWLHKLTGHMRWGSRWPSVITTMPGPRLYYVSQKHLLVVCLSKTHHQ